LSKRERDRGCEEKDKQRGREIVREKERGRQRKKERQGERERARVTEIENGRGGD